MRILVVTSSHFKEYGGPFTAISQKIKYLNEKNIKNKLIYKSSNNYNYNLDLKPIIEDYDIVHIYGIWRPFLAKVFLIAKLLKKKIVISPLGAMEPWALNQKKLKKLIAWKLYQKKILNSADVVHATCNEEAENLIIITPGNSNFFLGGIVHLDSNADNVSVYSDGDSNSKLTLTDFGLFEINIVAKDSTNYYIWGYQEGADVPAFADQ